MQKRSVPRENYRMQNKVDREKGATRKLIETNWIQKIFYWTVVKFLPSWMILLPQSDFYSMLLVFIYNIVTYIHTYNTKFYFSVYHSYIETVIYYAYTYNYIIYLFVLLSIFILFCRLSFLVFDAFHGMYFMCFSVFKRASTFK